MAAELWFASQTKLEWERDYRRDIRLALETGAPALPALSTANIRELMGAALPLAQPTVAEEAMSVVERLVRRALSIHSRLAVRTAQTDTFWGTATILR